MDHSRMQRHFRVERAQAGRALEIRQRAAVIAELVVDPAERVGNDGRLVRQDVGLFGERQRLLWIVFRLGEDVGQVVQGTASPLSTARIARYRSMARS